MKNKEYSTIARSDIDDIIVHWTKPNVLTKTTAFDNLKKILDDGKLIGGGGFIKGSYKCVCFTETPISALVKVFSFLKINSETSNKLRYEPFGIAIKKERLYSQGGRPVIYSDSTTYDLLHENLKWRYVNFKPPQVDFTWEREWRIKTDVLTLDPETCAVIVPSKKYHKEINEKFGDKWLTFPLSVLGLPLDWF